MRAWLYAVVSSSKQELTLTDQESWARKTCAANGWTLERIFSAVTTGKKGVRKLLVQLIAELKATPKEQRPERVLMLRLDRVGRGSIVESQVAIREIRLLGPVVHTRDGGDEIVDGPMGELIEAVKFAAASQDNAVRREKSLALQARKREAGEHATSVPYGFVMFEKRLSPYEPEAVIIRGIFDRKLTGWGYQRIAVWASSIAPAKLRPNGHSRALTWGTTTIRSILANTRYRVIVGDAVFDAVQQLQDRPKDRPTPRWNWPLRGAVRCTCGALLLGEASGRNPPKGFRTRYYVCRRITQHGGRYPHHHAAKLEAQFVALLSRLRASRGLSMRHASDESVARLRTQRSDLLAQRDGLEARRTRAWELGEDGKIPQADVARRLEQLGPQIDAATDKLRTLERELAAAERRSDDDRAVSELVRGAVNLWGNIDTTHQRGIAVALSEYLGGLWCDPKQPGRLLTPRDGLGRSVDTLRNVDMSQRKADDAITKKFIQSITE